MDEKVTEKQQEYIQALLEKLTSRLYHEDMRADFWHIQNDFQRRIKIDAFTNLSKQQASKLIDFLKYASSWQAVINGLLENPAKQELFGNDIQRYMAALVSVSQKHQAEISQGADVVRLICDEMQRTSWLGQQLGY
jgi:hypothetical protein